MTQIACQNCQKLNESQNYCNFDCMIASAEAKGGKKFQPNGLPIGCVKYDGNMYEHEHGDHPTYIKPVKIEYVGPIDEGDREDCKMTFSIENPTDEDVRDFRRETHALIYTDGCLAVTMYECNYSFWSSRTGEYWGGRYNSDKNKLKVPL